MATQPHDQAAEQIVQIEEMEQQEAAEDEGVNETPPSDIVAYNELRSCADLFRMADEGNLIIQPEFQRDFIWKGTDQTRFIDSLVKQLPVPSMCFALDYRQNKWIVIDGLQRISTITRFLAGEDWKLAALTDIDPRLRGKNAATLKNAKDGELKVIFSRVQNQTLPVNIIRCDLTKRSHNEYIFTIFHRLNSGGIKLNNQEIRNCIFSGPLNEQLRALDGRASWRRINHMAPNLNYRFTKQEAILRFFAFSEQLEKYKGSISKFLNDYMFENRMIPSEEAENKADLFSFVADTLSERIFNTNPAPRLPATVIEAAMIGIASGRERVAQLSDEELRNRFAELRAHESLSPEFLAEGLSKPDRVEARLGAAKEIFSRP
ncbi:hypothetical protein GGC65_001924 [Sphingopyxis sp. OAS728]|uniref:DUF262 domain-containing protein n=1 Tax=Sphingopyxis sp. OAS728 TaxID=2663823 RepID=UPI001789BDD5|nr:DUF262 domain-containing protein [Sphingopyxis sp. OAS728]MBE1527468.1 hypothetical protein [Sphingopyxis sp. OAS728]